MRLDQRALDRTLLLRQHLLERTTADPLTVVEHLIGLQAQDNLPPYLSLTARIEDFDPRAVSAALEGRRAVRFFTMRGTVHLLTADDALVLRRWVQPTLDRVSARSVIARPAHHLAGPALDDEVAALLADGAVPVKRLGEALAAGHPGVPAEAVVHLVRETMPLLQTPPRGLWRRSGGVAYAHVEQWLGVPQRDLDLPLLVRRYLRAYGPATAADMTTWSGVTRLGPVFAAMELEVHEGPDGKPLYDVPDAPLADADVPAPPRLLGKYDNLWLSHAARDRVLSREDRPRWMAANGGAGNTFLVDGAMAGLWHLDGRDRSDVRLEPWRTLSQAEQSALDDEVDRVRALLAVPPHEDR